MSKFLRKAAVLTILLMATGCATIVGNATGSLAESLSNGILNQDDPELVRDGAPAYLLLVDGLIADNPESEPLLLAGATLYGAYAGAFVTDADRGLKLANRARDFGTRVLCLKREKVCAAINQPFESFEAVLPELGMKDLDALYAFASTWATWIQANSGDWNAIAEVPKIEAAMKRVVALEPEFEAGWPHLYLGVLATQLPPAYGGKPEDGLKHFDVAREMSQGQNLMVDVMCAQQYARLVFDKELHDSLLSSVLSSDATATGFTLTNTLAQEQAAELLAESDDYF